MENQPSIDRDNLLHQKRELEQELAEFGALNLSLNMARGKPSSAQLDLSLPLLNTVSSLEECLSEDGVDCRNYGVLEGLPEARRFMACMLDDQPENVFVGGSSSLTLMYDFFARFMNFGSGGSAPWSREENLKWICPVPGYDRHFSITQEFGFEMIDVPMGEDGPDMDEVESLVASDPSVKGIWCVPKYSNPTGAIYSDETVRRLASMECAAPDFKIFWDNAYCVHYLSDEAAESDRVPDIGSACRSVGNDERYLKFASTSKITFPGSGMAAFAASPKNLEEARAHLTVSTIGYNKLNQLRHVQFLKDSGNLALHMRKHAAIMAPKFELVSAKLSDGLGDLPDVSWTNPRGGYFVSFEAPSGCAKRVVQLAKDAGVVLTAAGSTWPRGIDPADSNIRIAPTMPTLDELSVALDIFVACVKLARVEKLLGS